MDVHKDTPCHWTLSPVPVAGLSNLPGSLILAVAVPFGLDGA